MQNLIRLRSKLRRNQEVQVQVVGVEEEEREKQKQVGGVVEGQEGRGDNGVSPKTAQQQLQQQHQQQQQNPTDIVVERQQPELILGQSSQLNKQPERQLQQIPDDVDVMEERQQNQLVQEQLNAIESDVVVGQALTVQVVRVDIKAIQILHEQGIQQSRQVVIDQSSRLMLYQSQPEMIGPLQPEPVIAQKKSKIQMLREKIRLKKSMQQSAVQTQPTSQTSYKRPAQYQLEEDPSNKYIQKPQIKQIERSSQISIEQQLSNKQTENQPFPIPQPQQPQQQERQKQQQQQQPEVLLSQLVDSCQKQVVINTEQQRMVAAQDQEQDDKRDMGVKDVHALAPSHTLFYQLNQVHAYLHPSHTSPFPQPRQASSTRLSRIEYFLKQLQRFKHNINALH